MNPIIFTLTIIGRALDFIARFVFCILFTLVIMCLWVLALPIGAHDAVFKSSSVVYEAIWIDMPPLP